MIIKNKFRKLKSFTLVELTISMGILALIVGLTAGVLVSVVKSYQKQRTISEIESNGDFVMRTFEESLRGATSIACVRFNGNVIAADVTGATTCDMTSDRLLYVNYGGISERYFGRGSSGTSANCPTSTTTNCFVYSIPARSSIDVAFNLPSNENSKMTNDSTANGVHVSSFIAVIRGGGTSGQPHNITVTMDVNGSIGSLGENESRTFQSFLTLRGSY